MNLVKKLIELDAKTSKLIAVVGDALMDIYVHGTLADCQDGCQKFMESYRVECPGGAANAANALVNWNCNVQLHSNIAPGTKTRFMFGERCVLRHDDDTIDRASTLEARRRYMFSLLAKSKPDAILISDYDKGFLTPDFIRKVISFATESDIRCVVDAKREPTLYRGSIIKANDAWAETYAGFIPTPFICTNGKNGPDIWLNAEPITLADGQPIIMVNHVGAGDCFSAHLVLGLAHGFSLEDSAAIAHSAGRIYVQFPHNRPPMSEEIAADFEGSEPSLKV